MGSHVITHIDGTLNDNIDIDRGWTAEIVLLWVGMSHLANVLRGLTKVDERWQRSAAASGLGAEFTWH